jgi:hypothetical protein
MLICNKMEINKHNAMWKKPDQENIPYNSINRTYKNRTMLLEVRIVVTHERGKVMLVFESGMPSLPKGIC